MTISFTLMASLGLHNAILDHLNHVANERGHWLAVGGILLAQRLHPLAPEPHTEGKEA